LFFYHNYPTSITSVPVLNGINYQRWAVSMQSYLENQGLWQCILSTPPLPFYMDGSSVAVNADRILEWELRNIKAVGNIRLSLHHAIMYKFMNEESATALWGLLQKEYGQPLGSETSTEPRKAIENSQPTSQNPQLKRGRRIWVNPRTVWEFLTNEVTYLTDDAY